MNRLIQQNVPLADKTWFKTGGSAKFYCEPTTPEEFQQAIQFAKEQKVEFVLIGEGANILISDDGFDGLVIRPALKTVSFCKDGDTPLVTAGAGLSVEQLIEKCLEKNILGLEEFSGIPGTVGGAVYINLHYFQFFLADFLESAQVIDKETATLQTVSKEWFNFGYDQSKLLEKKHFLVSATFKLKKVDDLACAHAQGRRKEIIRHRTSRYPNKNTCGSFFRNFLDDEVTIISNGRKMIYVAYYLDKLGIKGALTYGKAHVSYQHANMLVTESGATTDDVVMLARDMQERVKKEFEIIPQPECQLIGFKKYPFLK